MNKQVFLYLSLFLFYYTTIVQGQEKPILFDCGTDHFHQELLQKEIISTNKIKQMEEAYQMRMESAPNERMACGNGVITLPVVVHVVYGDYPSGSGNPTPIGRNENLSIADIQLGIAYLNQAFAGMSVCDGEPSGENIGIQFCLAQRDINNNPSDGITRHYAPNLTDLDQCTEDAALKNLSQTGGTPNVNPWPATDYINIWLVQDICNTCSNAGCDVGSYATFPAAHGTLADGLVNEANLWASDCHNAKVGVHDLGHYFNLYHTFQGGCTNTNCLVDGDKVCDTPPDNDNTLTSPCYATNSCTTDANSGFATDQNDLRNNYMDYGELSCKHTFTFGQKTRILDALCHTRNSLMNSLGCLAPCSNPITASFTYAPTSPINAGTTVNFTNTSTGNASNYQWSINNVPFSTATNPSYTFTSAGDFEISLVVSSNDPNCASDSINLCITALCPLNATFSPSISEINQGEIIDFVNTTTGATTYEWFIDGVSQGTSTDLLNVTFANLGTYEVYLKACDALCCSTSEVILITVGGCNSREKGAIWYFGSNAGLDFNTDPPSPLTNGQLSTSEGCASIADNNGNLLFYTDGITVWDRNHNIMPNGTGLFGNPSSTQSAIIVPYPTNASLYYIITVDYLGGTNGFRYSIVDLSLNGGIGGVTTKNVLVFQATTEKVTAVQHCNGRDYWVIGHVYGTNAFRAYLIDPGGLNPVPVVSNVGIVHGTGGVGDNVGYMKASPQGDRIAVATWTRRIFEVLDFDQSTGVLSNPITLASPNYEKAYGVEFSPDGSKLYGTKLENPSRLLQFDLNAGSAAAINASVIVLHSVSRRSAHGALQLGLDGKIYVANNGQTNIGIINFPNNLGAACNYVHNSVPVGGSSSAGLPTIFPNFFIDKTPYIAGEENACPGDEFTYTATQEGDGECDLSDYAIVHIGNASVINQSDVSITLNFNQAGTDTLIAVKTSVCEAHYDTLIIETPPQPTFSWMDADTILCPGQNGFAAFSTDADIAILIEHSSGNSQTLSNNIAIFNNVQVDDCYSLQLIHTATNCETIVDVCVRVSEPCCPSSVGDFSSVEYRCASDAAAPPSHIPSLAEVIATLDVNADDKTLTWMPLDIETPIAYAGNGCDPQIYDYELIVGCTNDPDLALSAGVISVVIYPEIDATDNVIIDDGICGPSIEVECSNYVVTNDLDSNGASPDYSPIDGIGSITFTLTNTTAQANGVDMACTEMTYTANYRCCNAEAGLLQFADATLCPGDSIIASTNDANGNPSHQLDTDYIQTYLLIDDNGIIIDQISNPTPNEIEWLPVPGDYWVCSYNESSVDAPIPSPHNTTNLALTDIGSTYGGCFDQYCWPINVPAPLVVTCNQDVTQGSGASFGYNTHEICLEGGTLPYHYNWDVVGYVRHSIIGTGHIRIDYNTNATWAVSITDAHGCIMDIDGNVLAFSNSNHNDILSIYNHEITNATSDQFCNNGAISVYAQGGDGNYNFTWTGPAYWTPPTSTIGTGNDNGGVNNVYNLTNLTRGWYSVTVTDGTGTSSTDWYWVNCDKVGGGRGKLTSSTTAFQIYPNPFDATTTIEYTTHKTASVQIHLFDLSGRKISTLVDIKQQSVDTHQVVWNGVDLPSGIYLYQIVIDKEVFVGKLVKK